MMATYQFALSGKTITKTLIIAMILVMFFFIAENSFAAACYDWDTATPVGDPNGGIGGYINCAIPKVWTGFKIILVALALGITLWLIFKTAVSIGSANSQEIQQLPSKWLYVIILGFVAIGAAGSVINILLDFFGFGAYSNWLTSVNVILNALNKPIH